MEFTNGAEMDATIVQFVVAGGLWILCMCAATYCLCRKYIAVDTPVLPITVHDVCTATGVMWRVPNKIECVREPDIVADV